MFLQILDLISTVCALYCFWFFLTDEKWSIYTKFWFTCLSIASDIVTMKTLENPGEPQGLAIALNVLVIGLAYELNKEDIKRWISKKS